MTRSWEATDDSCRASSHSPAALSHLYGAPETDAAAGDDGAEAVRPHNAAIPRRPLAGKRNTRLIGIGVAGGRRPIPINGVFDNLGNFRRGKSAAKIWNLFCTIAWSVIAHKKRVSYLLS